MTRVKLGGKLLSIVILCGGVSALAQTQVDLQAQSKRVNFSAAASTKPMKTGATLPATCSTGELFFNTSSPAGSNVYGCVFTNAWALQETLPTPGANGSLLSMGASSATWVPLGGDVTGAPDTVTVKSLQSRPISTSAPQTGQALVWNGSAWEPQMVVTGQGTVQMQADGTLVGARGTVNFVSGFGLLNTFTDTGTRLDVQQNVDTALIETRANQQAGASLLCASAGASATTYTCAMTPTLAAYTTGMVLRWKPDVSATGGATTLNVDSLGAKSIKLPDGTTDPRAGDVAAGGLYNIWYDGTNFRLMSSESQQTGAALLCASAGASATTYTCAMTPTLAAYTTGMVLRWKPDVSASGGATTLNVDSLGAKAVKLADGATDPRAGDVVAGGLYNIWYDGTKFRLMSSESQQTGASLLCASAGASATTYTCAMTPALAAYTTGMVLRWKPDVSATGGATTLNVDSLGAKSVKLPDGTTDPRAGDLAAGGLYNLWYDGTNFRLMFSPGMSESAPASRPTCDATRRGRLWMSLGASEVKDELAVCAKAADNTYAWRTLY